VCIRVGLPIHMYVCSQSGVGETCIYFPRYSFIGEDGSKHRRFVWQPTSICAQITKRQARHVPKQTPAKTHSSVCGVVDYPSCQRCLSALTQAPALNTRQHHGFLFQGHHARCSGVCHGSRPALLRARGNITNPVSFSPSSNG
jgi:hypothetical protein